MDRITKIDMMFAEIIGMLPQHPDEAKFWTNGFEILSKDRNEVEAIADLFDQLYGTGTCVTGTYGKAEDIRNGEADECTGYHYVKIGE